MKKILSCLLTIILGLQLNATPVKSEAAKTVAVNWYKNYTTGKSNYTVKSEWTAKNSSGIAFYAYNFVEGGYVLVSGDDVASPILGYATTGEINAQQDNPALKSWLNSYVSQIDELVKNKADKNNVAKEWEQALAGSLNKSSRAVTPLVTTKWNQDPFPYGPWSMYCPSGTYAGCVAVAASQVMKFWNHPATGTGSHSYSWDMDDNSTSTNQTISTSFDSTFAWTDMPNTLTNSSPLAQRKAVAKLLYRVGVSVNMDYGQDGSGAFTENLVFAMKNYFKYDRNLSIEDMSNYTPDAWSTMLKTELDAGRPMVYAGTATEGGHAFVCDGYDASTPAKFHFNWGWSGSADGYFAIGALNSGNGNFNANNRAIIGAKPNTTLTCNIDTPTDSSSVPLNQTVTFVANVYDAAKSISKVDFYVDDVLKTSDDAYPYSYEFNSSTLTLGYHELKAVATDNTNNTASDSVNINVSFGSWQEQATGFTAAARGISKIFIANKDVVWATAYDGSGGSAKINEFTKTTNGGTTWTPYVNKIPYSATSYGVGNICPLDGTNAWVAIFPQSTATASQGVYKTTNGGTNWTKQTTAAYGSSSFLNFVHMFDADNGFCMGDPKDNYMEIYTTSNGGTTWTRVPKANIAEGAAPDPDEYGTVGIFDAIGETAWFLSTTGNVFKTTDKGLTWTKSANAAPGNTGSVSIRFLNPSIGMLSYNTGSTSAPVYKLRRTTDGGTTWTDVTPNGACNVTEFAPVRGTDHEWISVDAVQGASFSSYSFDDGANWVDLDHDTQYTAVNFFDKTAGWAGGFSQTSTVGGIYKWISATPDAINDNDRVIPVNASLKQNYPNPFNPTTTIEFNLKGNSQVNMAVYDAMGREVATLANGSYTAGSHSVKFDAGRLAAGVYFYSLKVQGQNAVVKKMMLVK